jgi:hypothetical protein
MPQFVFKHKKTVEQLYSPKEELAMEAIKNLRNTGDPSVVPYVVDLYVSTDNPKIEKALENFLKDIKDQKAVHAFINAIKNPSFEKKLTQLVGICWQTPLNFGPYIDVFVDIAIEKDYQTTIEAFTVVEEALPYASPRKISSETEKIKHTISSVREDKQLLLSELIKTMQSYS